jgi:general nucleoside transport system ATP-binding protein
MRAPSVRLVSITRRFGALVANREVTLEISPGEIHALVGENGAGKTTLMRVLYGLLEPHAGHIEFDGRPVRIESPAAAMKLGIGMVHQHFMLVEPLTVAENVVLGREPRRALAAFDRERAESEVRAFALERGLPVDARAQISSLSVGAQQRVEILKALHRGARVLILDEPTAVLTPQEADDLFAVLRDLKAGGAAVVLITHKLAEVFAVADRVTVMRAGSVVESGPVAAFTRERVAELMVGRPIAPLEARADRAPGAPMIEAAALEVADDRGLPAVRGVSFAVRGGEIVGIAGVEGNGQHELIEALAGLRSASAGAMRIGGRAVSGHSPREHAAAGLAHIPSDRLKRGLVPGMTLAENLALGRHRERGWGGFASRSLARHAVPLLEQFDVRPRDPGMPAAQLSGGNQQKLIVARELTRGATAVLASHPTRGVDLGAVNFIHRRLLAERDAGHAVLLVSSELSEILALSDRVLVMYEGRIVHETRPEATDERTLGMHMTGRAHSSGGTT